MSHHPSLPPVFVASPPDHVGVTVAHPDIAPSMVQGGAVAGTTFLTSPEVASPKRKASRLAANKKNPINILEVSVAPVSETARPDSHAENGGTSALAGGSACAGEAPLPDRAPDHADSSSAGAIAAVTEGVRLSDRFGNRTAILEYTLSQSATLADAVGLAERIGAFLYGPVARTHGSKIRFKNVRGAFTKERQEAAQVAINSGLSTVAVAHAVGIHPRTIYRSIKCGLLQPAPSNVFALRSAS